MDLGELLLWDVPAEMIIREHYRLGSTRAILSRSFCNTDIVTELSEIEKIFRNNMKRLREFERQVEQIKDFSENKEELKKAVEKVVRTKKGL